MLRIDTHQHLIPPDYRKALQKAGLSAAGGRVLPDWSPETALQNMAELGIGTAILSVSTPGTAFLPSAADAAALARDISGAASHFLLNQLPELYAGLQRDPTGFPVQYLGANVPQAWAAGTPFVLLQAMLGLQQDAPRGKLYVDPALPAWLPDMTLIDLRLGRRRFDIRFWRDGKETLFEVLRGKRSAVERKAASALRKNNSNREASP